MDILLGCLIGSSLLMLATGFGLGILCGVIYVRKTTKNTASGQDAEESGEQTDPVSGPVYEEIKTENKGMEVINLSQNLAYGHISN